MLSSPADMEITVRGGSNDDCVYHLSRGRRSGAGIRSAGLPVPAASIHESRIPPIMVEDIFVRPVQTYHARYTWWDSVWGSSGEVNAWAAAQVVVDLVLWYLGEVRKNPTFHLISHSSIQNIIDQTIVTNVQEISSGRWWLWWGSWRCRCHRIRRPRSDTVVSHPESPQPRVITPAAVITVDPVIFALKSETNYTVADIKGRLVIDGGTDNESSGDTLVIHNEDGSVTTGTLTSETIAVMDGERIQAFDASGKALFDGGVVFKRYRPDTAADNADSDGHRGGWSDVHGKPGHGYERK